MIEIIFVILIVIFSPFLQIMFNLFRDWLYDLSLDKISKYVLQPLRFVIKYIYKNK